MLPKPIEELFRTAVSCQDCFKDGRLRRSLIDLPQPRLIGDRYWSCPKRTLVLLINPGSGARRSDIDLGDKLHCNLIRQFRSGMVSVEDIFKHQREDIGNWGRFVSFYSGSLGLNIDDLAIANVAWCSTDKNRYPVKMLNKCFELHTKRLIEMLKPIVMLLGGVQVHRFREQVGSILTDARLILTPHFAHRKGREYERRESVRIKAEIAG